MSAKKDVLWPAPPHTIAKIDILKGYLNAYLPILGMSKRGHDLLLVDGFAGPGEYTNHTEGSPIAMLNAATKAREIHGSRWVAGTIHCAFIEGDTARFDHLEHRMAECRSLQPIHDGAVQIHTRNCTFAESISDLKNIVPESFFENWPLFVFIDPFGATGVPFSTVAEILRSPCSEILINLDVDGIARNFCAGNEHILDVVFGDEAWRESLEITMPLREQCRRVLELYKAKLRSLHKVRYVFAFEMRSKSVGLTDYYLVFASQHPLGLEKMKEAMKRIDQDGRFRFCDAHVGHENIFRFDAPEDWMEAMYRQFSARPVPYEEIRDYTLNETPFINPTKVLALLEDQNLIADVRYRGERRRRAFSPEKTISVTFK